MKKLRPIVYPGADRDAAESPWKSSSDNSWWEPDSNIYPSTDLLLPGDVLLFAPIKPDPTQKVIQAMQRRWGASAEHAQFTHAALYIGLDHLICEAVPLHGVSYSALPLRLDKNCWIARRWPGLEMNQRRSIAREAVRLLGCRYGTVSIMLETLKHGWGAKWDQRAARGLVCSRLCDRAITLGLLETGFPSDQLHFHPNPARWVTPAVLSETKRLVDVESGWRRVEQHA